MKRKLLTRRFNDIPPHTHTLQPSRRVELKSNEIRKKTINTTDKINEAKIWFFQKIRKIRLIKETERRHKLQYGESKGGGGHPQVLLTLKEK